MASGYRADILSLAWVWPPIRTLACHPHWGEAGKQEPSCLSLLPLISKNKLESSPHLPPIFSCLTPDDPCPQMRPHVCPLLDRWAGPEVQMVGALRPLWSLLLQLRPAGNKALSNPDCSGVGALFTTGPSALLSGAVPTVTATAHFWYTEHTHICCLLESVLKFSRSVLNRQGKQEG